MESWWGIWWGMPCPNLQAVACPCYCVVLYYWGEKRAIGCVWVSRRSRARNELQALPRTGIMPSLTGFLQTVRSREEACQVSARWCLMPQKQINIEVVHDYHIPLFPHPPSLPDLNPIEPIWHELKTIIHHLPHPPTTLTLWNLQFLQLGRNYPLEKSITRLGRWRNVSRLFSQHMEGILHSNSVHSQILFNTTYLSIYVD